MKNVLIILMFLLFQLEAVSIELNSTLTREFRTDFSKASISLKQVFNGGPGKDGIPAINNPKFSKVNHARFPNDTLGVLIKIDNTVKFYPYNILVWHEIVNDSIGDNHFTVTFCPLCGSAITFNREFNDQVHSFGVSGLLYESNLLMYDNVTESFWSQAKGEAVVGDYLGKKLEILNMNVIEFKTLKDNYPNALVLSKDTGHIRNYNFYPYGNYEENKQLYFPTSKYNARYHPKELMYVFRYDKKSFTFPIDNFESNTYTYKYKEKSIIIRNIDGEIQVSIDKQAIPGYFEMWFSWVIHNEKVGVLIDKIK